MAKVGVLFSFEFDRDKELYRIPPNPERRPADSRRLMADC